MIDREAKDTYKHQGLRKRLIEALKGKGIKNEEVLEAMMRVPRHLFMDSSFLSFAYDDQAFPIGAGQTISQPYTVAFQTSLLDVKKGEKVLEIGTGSGYQASVLCEMGVKLFTIERQRSLFEKSKKMLDDLGYRVRVLYGDGYKGLPAHQPFDKILVTCGAPFIPEDLIKQLKIGGKLVIPVGAGDIQEMTLVVRDGEESVIKEKHGLFRFVPMLEKKSDNGE